MSAVQINDVVKRYGALEVVHGINLAIQPQEFVVLVGPSGCGKSTTLRMVAGLEDISDGTVSIGGRVVNKVAPKDRDVAMVFQNYALYPHLNVAENIAFGLRVRGEKRDVIDKAVVEAAQILGLTDYLARKPADLSGGQRQRVAMGRAIVRRPKVFLFDEPLSNLDAKLRTHMRAEIKHLHKRMQATSIYVTHDQVEAMTLADRIVIMNGGNIEQIGSPMEVFLEPANTFVAGFIGSPPMNLLDAVIAKRGGGVKAVLTGNTGQSLSIPDAFAKAAAEGQPIKLGLRPEIMSVRTGDGRETLDCAIELVEPLGAEALLHGKTDGHSFIAKAETLYSHHELNAVARLGIDTARIHVFDAATGRSLKAGSGLRP
ncbi:ABC transporter ATP-binding protein [Rhizobium sullae]|uniref:sn-glycerol-3-phosphate ABC transporter ATP-binding protein UgpC n=1 Tax=Rhizobium sullae TaxID=50338 RepID=A0A2N0DGC4_RHISU|nr:sn-glycerol-3-phosphate ABC transporter ATP-binding protein UgpC [Rhizobium sullae]PKA45152.1 sn-glycerol-3-phosphate ABC transporter ATP-binding protein UgpC [Rhizobium sullae]UWU17332.1 sn-glycerol-3-phosphate ABC transporter ATP-binding protein UgpC [Rhizobium sullae]